MTIHKAPHLGELPSYPDICTSLHDAVQTYIVKRLGPQTPDSLFAKSNLLRMGALLFTKNRALRDIEFVKQAYDQAWENIDFSKFQTNSSNTCRGNWRGEHFEIVKMGIKRVHLYLLSEILDSLKPHNVLEIGCGIGINLAFFCRKFPNIDFSGLELSLRGIKTAEKLIKKPPKELIDFYPALVSSEPSFNQFPTLYQASAHSMPLKDNSFEFVYSVQALEQMNRIRVNVFKEIYRVTSNYACFVEAFKDYNKGTLALNMIERDYFRGTIKELNKHGLKVEMVYDDLPTKNKMKIVCVLARKV